MSNQIQLFLSDSDHNETTGFFHFNIYVKFNGKDDTIYFALNEWGLSFEPWEGNFTDEEMEQIKVEVFTHWTNGTLDLD